MKRFHFISSVIGVLGHIYFFYSGTVLNTLQFSVGGWQYAVQVGENVDVHMISLSEYRFIFLSVWELVVSFPIFLSWMKVYGSVQVHFHFFTFVFVSVWELVASFAIFRQCMEVCGNVDIPFNFFWYDPVLFLFQSGNWLEVCGNIEVLCYFFGDRCYRAHVFFQSGSWLNLLQFFAGGW